MTEAPALDFDVASALALGARARQEDALAVAFPEGAQGGFAILSDGMGGHAAGDVASRTIVNEVFARLTLHEPEASRDLPALLRDAVARANAGLGARVRADPARRGMGGTVVAAVARGARLHWISVGDSVLYLFRDDSLARLNADHSMAPQIDLMMARGMLTRAEAESHPQRNCLTSALMGSEIAEVDCPARPLDLRAGDVVILASDGLQFLPDPIIEALLLRARRDTSRDIARDLMQALRLMDDPEQDNTALVVIRAETPRPQARPSPIRATSQAVVRAVRRAVLPPALVTPRR